MDAADKAILRILQEDADVSTKVLADAVELSVSAVERRITKMKRTHIIERCVAIVNPKAVNRTLSIIVEVEIQNEYRHTLDSFQRWLDRAPEVQFAWYITGDMDYLFIVSVRDLEEYNGFIERMMNDQKSFIRKYRSAITLKTVKKNSALTLD